MKYIEVDTPVYKTIYCKDLQAGTIFKFLSGIDDNLYLRCYGGIVNLDNNTIINGINFTAPVVIFEQLNNLELKRC